MNRSTNFNFYLPGNADPMLVSDLTYNFEQIDGAMLSKGQQTLTANEKAQIKGKLGFANQSDLDAANAKIIVFVTATVTIDSIPANSYASANVDVDIPAGTNGVKTVIPRYTSAGMPIAGAYPISGAASGKSRITVGVYNFANYALSDVEATVDVGFMY